MTNSDANKEHRRIASKLLRENANDLSGTSCDELLDCDDAGRAVRRWFATCWELGPRH